MDKIGAAIARHVRASSSVTKRFSKVVALSNELELEGLFKGVYPDGEYLIRLREVKPFHRKAESIVSAG
jgi:hypothetical protein